MSKQRQESQEQRKIRQALEDDRNTYQEILDETDASITVIDAKSYHILYANQGALNATKDMPGEYVGSICYQYIQKLDTPCEHCMIPTAAKGDYQAREIQYGNRYYKQLYKMIQWHGRPALLEYTEDITDHKANIRKLEELYDNELRIRRELLKDAVVSYQINLTQGIVEEKFTMFPNPQGKEAPFALTEETFQKGVEAFVDASSREQFIRFFSTQHLLQAWHNGTTRVILPAYRLSLQGVTKWFTSTVSMMLRPETGDVIAVTYTNEINDEQNNKLAIERTIAEEMEFVAVINKNTGMVRLVTRREKEEHAPTVEKEDFEEYKRREILPHVKEEEREAFDREYTIANIVETLEHQPIFELPYLFVGQQEQRKQLQAFYLDDYGQMIVLTRRDTTTIYQKEREQVAITQEALKAAKEASNAKTEFLSKMSHDIRTPMNTIVNLTNMIREEIDDREAVLADLKKIEASNHFLLSLVNDILDMSKIEQKSMELHGERYNYGEFIEYLHSTFDTMSQENGITFTIEEHGEMADILIDRVRFNQLCINLISNAIKYTPTGGHVRFSVFSGESRNGHFPCDLYVEDDGIGMSEEFQKNMFEPFAQEGRKYKTVEGTGLGLSIVKEIVDLLHGTLEVESRLNEGTRFHIHLQLEVAQDQKPRPKKAVDLSLLDGLQILLAEDHPLNQEIACRLLSKVNVHTVVVEDGLEAVEMFKKHGEVFDAILMDMRMPVMGGLEATRQIRALDMDKARTIPIIAMTANNMTEDRDEAEMAGITDYVPKPIDVNVLYETIAKYIISN